MRRSTTNSASNLSLSQDSNKMRSTTTSTFPPPHKTQLPMRYQTQQYQNAYGTNRSHPTALICKRSLWVIFTLVLSFLLVSLYLISLARGVQFSGQVSSSSKKKYGVVIDAGSSGSRIHVFQYKNGLIPVVDLVGLDSMSLKRTPGLSSFAGWFDTFCCLSVATVVAIIGNKISKNHENSISIRYLWNFKSTLFIQSNLC